MMPNVSGLGLLSLLKNFYLDRIPVILISSLDKGDVITNSLGLGAACFLAKPIDLVELLESVKNALEKSRAI
jgi:DNA-binding response OmpR family regulator